MKYKWLSLILVFFCLSGCGIPQPAPAHPTAESVPSHTEPAGLYLPGSHLEEATGGALKVFPLGRTDATAIAFLGENLLLFQGREETTLTLLSGDQRYISATQALPFPLSPADSSLQIWNTDITCYDANTRELIFLDAALKETHRIHVPEAPILSDDRNKLYYCTEDGLWELDLATELNRLLAQMSFPEQTLTGLHRSGSILECSVTDRDGIRQKLCFSAADGRLINTLPANAALWTDGDYYCCIRPDGDYREILCGTEEPRVLETDPLNPDFFSLPSLHGGLTVTHDPIKDATTLDYYDLDTGTHPARLTLPGNIQPIHAEADPRENAVWLLLSGEESDLLCRWDLSASKTGDSRKYLQPRYTLENPDLNGLAECKALAEQISEKHGVRLLIWADAVSASPWDYDLTAEHRVRVIRHCLAELDAAFSCYPPGFLREAAAGTQSGEITLCLVRDLSGRDGTGAPAKSAGVQYWDPEGNARLLLSTREDLAQTVHHELFHIFESRVFSHCDAYDSWQTLNPSGFSYDYNYTDHLSRQDCAYLSGDQRAFIDAYSMSYPREDRARIMEYALLDDQQDCFQSETMQRKLRTLCLGLREAFCLTDYYLPLPWEQYLAEPIR